MKSTSYSRVTLVDDLEMTQAKEAAADPKSERGGALGFNEGARIVQAQFADALTQLLKSAALGAASDLSQGSVIQVTSIAKIALYAL